MPNIDASEGQIGRLRPWLTLGCFLAWVAAANFTWVAQGDTDLFVHMRIGKDILSLRAFPRADVYSATASGRPFIAHEWGAGVLFYLVYHAMGSFGLNLLQVALALLCAGLMYYMLPPRLRGSALALPILLLCNYILTFRMMVRPHLFSIVCQSVLILILERWRKRGGLSCLLPLIPLQALWINLHGGALSGAALVAVFSVGVGLTVVLPGPCGDARRFTRRDLSHLGLVLAGMLGAMLVNPYGIGMLKFSFEMWSGNSYIKELIDEWRPTFSGFWFQYLPYLCIALLLLLWIGLLSRLRERPFCDLSLALSVTALAFQAYRFTPELAIVACPIVGRSVERLLSSRPSLAGLRRRPLLELLVLVPLFLSTVARGHPVGPGLRRAFDRGLGPNKPQAAADFLAERAIGGRIYCQYEHADYLIYRLYPRIKPVIDGRIDIYGEALVREFRSSRASPQAFLDYVRKYRVNVVLLEFGKENRAIYDLLSQRPEWQLIYPERDIERARSFIFVTQPASGSER